MESILYPSAAKRLVRRICQPCIAGSHRDCQSHLCPCLCQDDDFHATRVPGFGTGTLRMLKNWIDWTAPKATRAARPPSPATS